MCAAGPSSALSPRHSAPDAGTRTHGFTSNARMSPSRPTKGSMINITSLSRVPAPPTRFQYKRASVENIRGVMNQVRYNPCVA